MKKYYIYILLFLFSCNNKSKNTGSNNIASLEFIKTIKFYLDIKTRNWSMNNQYVYDSISKKEFICILNGPTNSINFFNLSGKKIIL